MAEKPRKRLGELLVDSGVLTEEQLQKALELQKSTGKKLGEVVVIEGFITEAQMIMVLETQLGIKSMDLSKTFIDPEAVKMVPENLCRKYKIIGIQLLNGTLILAMKDPLDYYAIEDVKLAVKFPLKQVIASEKDISNGIERFFSRKVAEQAVEDYFREQGGQAARDAQLVENAEANDDVNNAPIVRFINSVIENSVRNNASDIHIEPDEKGVRIRIRIDGVLRETMTAALETANAIVSRLKILAGLNIAEKRVPQDGRISHSFENKRVDLRVSTLPTTYGEKIVMRIMDKSNFVLTKEKLGLNEADLAKFDAMIGKPHGIILVTGPTGSGKTSTLYAVLNELNDITKNIITLEDPVEYDVFGINQVQVNTKAGLSFAAGLRSILRQDPDVIMVGEIRDAETAEISIRSALTGHLVLSTLHTNDAPGAISRIMDMGVEPFLISSSVIGVIAQRLVRTICPHCKIKYSPDERDIRILSLDEKSEVELTKGKGCPLCNNGYKGRTAIFEIMEINRGIRILVDRRATTDEIREEAYREGMKNLRESCKKLVLSGVTTVDELARITYS